MFRLKTLLQVGLIVLGSSVFGFLYQQRFPTEARTLPITDQIEWSTIADRYYGYSFQIPAAWHKEMGVTPDRWTFYGEITSIEGRGIPSTMSKGLIKVDFSADPVGHWLPDPEIRNPNLDERGMATTAALIPLLPHGTWTEIHGMPALIVREKVTVAS